MAFTKILRQILPERLKRILQPGLRFIRNMFREVIIRPIIGDREFVKSTVSRSYRSKYGAGFNAYLDNRDEMYQYFINTGGGRSKIENQERYFSSGEIAFVTLQDILADQGVTLSDVTSLLEFASGYGRITRFLVTMVNPNKITVSDIDYSAIEINAKMFGTQPLVSAEHPADFVCNRTFEVIFVASLFSHLNFGLWHLWLERLYKLLEPGGLLIFSTHGIDHDLPENSIDFLVEDGFWFRTSNETIGRLDVEVYGTTWVTETWVRKIVRDYGIGKVYSYYQKKLWRQDIYVIK